MNYDSYSSSSNMESNMEKTNYNLKSRESISSDIDTGDVVTNQIIIDKAADNNVVRKLDFYLMPIFCTIYFLSFLDRGNIGNARLVGLQDQLGLTNKQYSTAVSVLYATYIYVEIPGVLLMKKIGPRRYISIMMFCWSLVTIFTSLVRNYAGLIVTRLLLGLFEGSVFPSQSLYITMTYKQEEQAKRQGYLYICSCASGAFGGLITTGIVKIQPIGDWLNWSWLYIIQGGISLIAAICVWFFLPDDPKNAYFFNEEEKSVMAQRTEQQQRYLGNPKFEKKEVVKAFLDFKVWVSAVTQFCVDLVLYGFSTFLPSILKNQLGFTTLQAQYLTIPVYTFSAIAMGIVAYISDRYTHKAPLIALLNVFGTVGYIILVASTNGGANYFATYLIAMPLYGSVGLNITWNNNNNAPHYRRATGLGINQTLGNLAGVVAGQIYVTAPYKLGNSVSLGVSVLAIILVGVNVLYLRRVNKIKDQILAGEEQTLKKKELDATSLISNTFINHWKVLLFQYIFFFYKLIL